MGQRWQYITQVFEARLMQEELNDLGEAGWELVTAHWEEYSYGGRTQQQARCILKRSISPDEDPDALTNTWERAAALGN